MIAAQTAFCCEMIVPSVKGAVKRAEIVFRGSIAEIRESEIVFHVDRVWKGHVPAVFAMPGIVWSSTPCMPGFFQGHVRDGAELLVYARRTPYLNIAGYVTDAGSRTTLVQDASEDLRKLGRGRPPTACVIRLSPRTH